jgi:phosphoribosylcarboxyaminoimidazole (NCAIR) mutase
MAKLNRVGKPTVGLIKAMDGVASITSSINKVTGAPVAYARTLSGSSNRVVRGASYLAKGADNISTNLAKKLRPTGENSYKVITNSDYKT